MSRPFFLLAAISTVDAFFVLPRMESLRSSRSRLNLHLGGGSVEASALGTVAQALASSAAFIDLTSTVDLSTSASAAATTATADGDWFASFVGIIESAIKLCDSSLMQLTGQKSFGLSIVVFTLFLKGLTYPLTYAQLQSTSKMQAIQPKVKEIQAKYASSPEIMNREMSKIYSDNNVNPLAGCLPSLVQIPIFIGLYRALMKLSNENVLNEPFLWLPNLEGPVYGTTTNDWLFKNWVDGIPPLGWHDTLCFLSIPILLTIMQTVSQKALQPPQDPNMSESAAASQQVLQYLPVLFGFFALNVPSGLGVYWVTNTLCSTAAMIVIKNQVKNELAAEGLTIPLPGIATGPKNFSEPAASASSSFTSLVADAEIVAEPVVKGFAADDDNFKTQTQKKKKKKGAQK
jgi:YidC/Oxa1 family membrane protein insertase